MLRLLPLLLLCTASLSADEPEWVTVGDPGNPADKTGFGAVAYEFQIMKHEVTCAQYAAFLNAMAATDTLGLYIPQMDGAPMPKGLDDIRSEQGCIIRTGEKGSYRYSVSVGNDKKPIVNISVPNALRFANWMHGGQTETGAYDITKGRALAPRSAEALVWLPSEDEWYKAAYYDAAAKRYWRYATRSDEPPVSCKPDATQTNAANYYWTDGKNNGVSNGYAFSQSDYYKPGSIYLFDVGSYPAASSHYGTLDQSGSVWEWTEGIAYETKRVIRGGGWPDEALSLRSTTRTSVLPTSLYKDVGFRLCRKLKP